MKTTHWELHYQKHGENNWKSLFPKIRSLDEISMDVEREYAHGPLDSEVKLVRVETTVEYFDEPA